MELRRFLRVSKPYRLQFAPFPYPDGKQDFTDTIIENIGAGGLLFSSPEPFSVERQLVIKIYLTGWRQDGEDLVEDTDENAVSVVTALSEVLRCDFDAGMNAWAVAVKFLGRIME